jgi:hypothetical protein
MSWDVMLMSMPPGAKTLDDIPEGYQSPPLGYRKVVLGRLRAALPEVDLSDTSWGLLGGDDFAIELNIGPDDEIPGIMLHVRGGPGALRAVRAIADALGVPALDCTTSELIDFDSPDAGKGFAAWRAYRDQFVKR